MIPPGLQQGLSAGDPLKALALEGGVEECPLSLPTLGCLLPFPAAADLRALKPGGRGRAAATP